MPSMYCTTESNMSIPTDDNLVMPLFSAVTSEIDTIRNTHMVFYDHVFWTHIVKIAFHTDKSPLSDFETTKAIQVHPHEVCYAIRSDILTDELTYHMPHFFEN